MQAFPDQLDLFTGRVRQPRAALERALHIAVVDMLRWAADPDWFWFHPASGEYRTPATAALLQRMGVRPGVPDLVLISPRCLFHGLELKRRGGRLTEEQRQVADWCHAHGGPFEICRTFDGAIAVLTRWGVLKTNVRIAA